MSQYITKIRTENGDMQIDYRALANLPKVNGKDLTGDVTLADVGAAPAEHTHDDVLKKILTSGEYGNKLPAAGNKGRIFFKKV